MKQDNVVDGQDLREMFAAATGWLEKSSAEIDALNVFPVPDGDTGTNMLLRKLIGPRTTVPREWPMPWPGGR